MSVPINEVAEYFRHYEKNNKFPVETKESSDIIVRFDALAEHMNWGKKAKAEQKKQFNDAAMKQFSKLDLDKLAVLQMLIITYKLAAVPPTSKSKCKRLLEDELFLNIYQYLSGIIYNHGTLVALANYSYDNNRVFPKARAKQNLATKVLLRLISGARN